LWQATLSPPDEAGEKAVPWLSVDADFFEMGGTSLIAGQLVAQMRRQFTADRLRNN